MWFVFFPVKQFSLLAEAISQERQELKAREKSQAQVIINRLKSFTFVRDRR